MENKIHLSHPPIYNHQSYESNALYYQSNVDDKEYIILIQSRCPNERICKYDIKNDKYTAISVNNGRFHSSSTRFPFKFPKLSQIITETNDSGQNNQLLTICTNKNQLAALNLDDLNYISNYQSVYTQSNHKIKNKINKSLMFNLIWPVILSIFLCNNSILVSLIYGMLFYFISIKIANFTHKFDKDIKCVIPHFELLYNIESCYIENDGIHFIANNYKNATILNHFKFNLQSRQFTELKPIVLMNKNDTNMNGETLTDIDGFKQIRAYKIVYSEFMKTLIMFTNTENIYYFDIEEQPQPQWRIYDDIQLPKIPGNGEWEINIVIGFKGIIFLFYYPKNIESVDVQMSRWERESDTESDSDYNECIFTYCWDLLFTGDMFECDNKYLFNSSNGHSIVACNTDNNYTHFIGENPLPFHFKISLTDEIPVELSIIHLQYFHLLIKQYILNTIHHKIHPNDIEMLILDYFPMFL